MTAPTIGTGGTASTASAPRSRTAVWAGAAAGAWTVLFAAPHVWWLLGVSAGFPGGADDHDAALDSAWFLLYDLFVLVLCAVGVLVALVTAGLLGRSVPRRLPRALAWLAAAVLTARGVAGLVADGRSDLVWWPTFLLGGVLYGLTAWSSTGAGRQREGDDGADRTDGRQGGSPSPSDRRHRAEVTAGPDRDRRGAGTMGG